MLFIKPAALLITLQKDQSDNEVLPFCRGIWASKNRLEHVETTLQGSQNPKLVSVAPELYHTQYTAIGMQLTLQLTPVYKEYP